LPCLLLLLNCYQQRVQMLVQLPQQLQPRQQSATQQTMHAKLPLLLLLQQNLAHAWKLTQRFSH
jgi:hypothetical protein